MAKKVKRVKKVMNMQRRPSAKAAVRAAAQSSSESTTYYVHGPRGILAQKDPSQNWEWMMQDGLGSVRSVVDNSSGVEWSGSPDPFGSYFGEAGTRQTPYGFTGEYTDPITGMVHLRARDYHPVMGAFTALDPLETFNRYSYVQGNPINDAVGELMGFHNRYSYANGNPVNVIDPSGLLGERPSQYASCTGESILPIVQKTRDFNHEDCLRGLSPANIFGRIECELEGEEIAARVRRLHSGCIIEVSSYTVAPLLGDHSFLLFTQREGIEFEYRAGPNRRECYERDTSRNVSDFVTDPNYICAQTNHFTAGTAVDWESGHNSRRTVLMAGSCVCSKQDCLNSVLQDINRSRILYNNFPPPIYNSNSVVRTLLESCGIPVIRPLLSGNLPGWENLLD
ncbi:MAG: RHS repeat-associated core domain-containing protein [Anaerolineae bacterium]|nr:RHS repeat-associated core domain-containing protein [Anaerolineae bacterium]